MLLYLIGGNSQLFVVACVTDSDQFYMDSINTLRVVSRVKDIQSECAIMQVKGESIDQVPAKSLESYISRNAALLPLPTLIAPFWDVVFSTSFLRFSVLILKSSTRAPFFRPP